MQHNVPTVIAVTKIDEAAREAIEAAGGRVRAVGSTVLPTLFLVSLPANATIATSFARRQHDIAIAVDGRDHIMVLETQGINVSTAHLRYIESFEVDDAPLLKEEVAL